jgi:hypothetical protein
MRRTVIVCLALLFAAFSTAHAQEYSEAYKAQLRKTAASNKARATAKQQAAAQWRADRAARVQAQAQAEAEARQEAILLGMQNAERRRAQRGPEPSSHQHYSVELREKAEKAKRETAPTSIPSTYHKGLNGPGSYYPRGSSNAATGYFADGKYYERGTGPHPTFRR